MNWRNYGATPRTAAPVAYDTYGFPVDLTADVCRERNIKSRQPVLKPLWKSNAVVRAKLAVLAAPGLQRDDRVDKRF